MDQKFVHKVRTYGLEYVDRFYGTYKAEVVRNDDPDDRGRVLLRVPILQLDNDAPIPNWALPKGGPFNRGSGRGSVDVPAEGDHVWVEFQNGNPDMPVYTPTGFFADGDMPEEFDTPDDRGWKTRSGHVVRFREKDGEESVLIRHKDEAEMEMDADGKVTVRTKDGDKLELDPSGKVTVEHRGGSKCELSKNKIEVDSDSGSSMTLKPKTAELESDAQVKVKSKRIVLDGSAIIEVGKSATSPIVKGNALASWLSTFHGWAVAHLHGPHAPGSPPVPPVTPPPAPPIPSMLSKTALVK